MKRYYGLFEKRNGKWVRVEGTGTYPKELAIRIFQNALLAYALGGSAVERRLRPVKQ